MDIIPHENNTGSIEPEILAQYGPFSLWERLKMGGTGSKRVYYSSGISYFDEVIGESTDLPFVNFEMLKNAIFIRLSIHNKSYTLSLKHNELERILLYTGDSTGKKLLLFVVQTLEKQYTFAFRLNNLSIASFFTKACFRDKFYMVDNDYT